MPHCRYGRPGSCPLPDHISTAAYDRLLCEAGGSFHIRFPKPLRNRYSATDRCRFRSTWRLSFHGHSMSSRSLNDRWCRAQNIGWTLPENCRWHHHGDCGMPYTEAAPDPARFARAGSYPGELTRVPGRCRRTQTIPDGRRKGRSPVWCPCPAGNGCRLQTGSPAVLKERRRARWCRRGSSGRVLMRRSVDRPLPLA